MQYDYLIIGQGISGTFLSYYLGKTGTSFLVIDEKKDNTASRVAAGLINPVTGRRLVKSWMTDELMPFAWEAYTTLGNELGIDCIRSTSLLQFFNAPDMEEAFRRKLHEEPEFLSPPDTYNWKQYFNYPFGWGVIAPCFVVDIASLLESYRTKLLRDDQLLEDKFSTDELKIEDDQVTYRHIRARKIIFCDGEAGMNSRWFSRLPYSPNKGEALWVRIPGLPPTHIYKF
ncbi:MAG TPA: FAD-dependent oxidoreductase, partial [Chitinophagaceae bacterium]|nr:FAD-dependent oxidoreductase [Chitinophagaceae bacterium]